MATVYYHESINDVGEAKSGYVTADNEAEATRKLGGQWQREVEALGNRPRRLIKLESLPEQMKIREALHAKEKEAWERGEAAAEEFRRGHPNPGSRVECMCGVAVAGYLNKGDKMGIHTGEKTPISQEDATELLNLVRTHIPNSCGVKVTDGMDQVMRVAGQHVSASEYAEARGMLLGLEHLVVEEIRRCAFAEVAKECLGNEGGNA